jgi:aryl-alcohol dehydrogenase-like predicted oxidoreductase
VEYRTLGRTGLRVSAIGFGCGNTGGLMVRGAPADQRAAVARALAGGITYFDTAAQYGEGRSEENLGRVLRELGADVLVGTKVRLAAEEAPDAAAALRRKLEEGLRRLGREQVDVCTLHNPTLLGAGARGLPLDAVLGPVGAGMQALRAAGLCRFAGFSGLGDTPALLRVASAGLFDTFQCYYNAINPSAGYPGSPDGVAQDFDGLLDRGVAAGLGVFAIRILAGGAAVASPERHPTAGAGSALAQGTEYERDVAHAAALPALAAELGLEGPLELAFRFALAKAGIACALIGPSSVAHVEDALRWEARGPLAADAVARVLALARPPAA